MHITLVDDSIPFDGYTASARPLGGVEKAFAALAGALARRGHQVVAFNRCRWSMFVEGAQWEPLDGGKRPLHTDLLIALRKPELLGFVRAARARALWHTAPGRVLERRATRALLEHWRPTVLLCSQAQAGDWQARGLKVALLPPALKSDFLAAAAVVAAPPHAIVTTHPAHGLLWLLELWLERIRPQAPQAELHVHSASLARLGDGGDGPPELTALAARLNAAHGAGVRVLRPEGDTLMAQSLRAAAVHLYPGHPDDCTAFGLLESQACGVPAVLRPLGAAPERVADGISAYVAPDDDAFANLAALLLTNDAARASLGAEARARLAGRTWDAAADKLESVLA